MALDLDKLVFTVETKQLDDAITKLGNLQTAVTKLNKPIQEGTVAAEKLAQAQAKTAVAAEKLAQEQAKTAATIAKLETVQSKQNRTMQESTTVTKSNMSVLERQQQILEFMTQGFSKGQASVLTYAKAAGALTDELKILGEVQQTQRKLQGSEPFDRSIGAVKVLKNELGALREAQRQYNAGVELTTKQAKDLYREKFRLIEAMKIERQAARDSGDATVSESQRYAKLKQDLRDINKEYVALSVQRNKLANDDSLVQTQRRVNNLSRGLAPQISDVAVSLYGGMSPMTVLMQQGLQVRDLIQQSGVEAKDLDATLKKTGADFLSTISGTFTAIGSLAMGVFSSMGEGIVSSLADVSGISLASKKMKELGFISEETTAKLAKFSAAVVGAALPFFAVVLGLTLKALYDVTKEQDALNNSLVTSGASLGLTATSARTYAESMNVLGVSTSKGLAVISEMAKVGGFTKESIDTIAVAATQMAKYTDLSIEDVVKSFDKLNDKPAKALSDFAIKTGLIPLAVLETVRSLEDQGKSAEATSVAIKAMGDAYQTQAAMAKAGMSTANLAWIELKSTLSGFYGELKKLAASDEMNSLITKLTNLYRLVVAFNVNTFRGIGDVANILTASGSPEAIGNAIDAMKKNNADSRKTYSDILGLNKDINGQTVVNTEQQKNALKLLERQTEQAAKGVEVAKAENWWSTNTEKVKTNAQKREEFALQIREKGLALGKSEKQIAEEIANFNAKHKDPKAENKVTDVSSVWEKITDAVNRATIAYDEVVNGSTKYTNSQKVMMDLMNDKKFLLFSEEDKKKALTSLANAHAKEVETEAHRNLLKVQLELQKVWDATVKARAAQDKIDFDLLDTTMALVQSGQAENEMLILQATLIGATDEVRKKSIKLKEIDIKYEKELAKIKAGTASDDAKKTAISDLAKWREQEEKNVNLIIANDASEKLLAEYNRIRDGIADSIVTALFEGGKAGSKKLRDLLVAELKKPITIVVKALVDSVVSSAIGSSVASSAGASALGGLLGAGGLSGAMLGGAGWLTGATTLGGSLSAATSLLTSGVSGILPGLGMLAGALGPIAIGLSLLSSLDDSGTMHTGGGATYNATTGTSKFGLSNVSAADTNQSTVNASSALVKGIVGILDSTAVTFGKTAGYEASTAFADDSSKDGAWGDLIISQLGANLVNWSDTQTDKWAPKVFADGEAGAKEYASALAVSTKDALMSIGLPEWATTMLKNIGDAPTLEQLGATVDNINKVKLALDTMSKASQQFADIGVAGADAIIAALGGAEAAINSMSSYYENFYSTSERTAIATSNVTAELAKLGKELPKTREQYRSFIDDALKAGNTELAASLIKLSSAFAQVIPATEAATTAVEDNAKAFDKAFNDWKTVVQREKSLLQEQLTTAESSANSLRGIFDTISNAINDLYKQTASTSKMLVSEANTIINSAIASGVLPSNLGTAITTAKDSVLSGTYTTRFEADKATIELANRLQELKDNAGEQLSSADKQVLLLKDQIAQYDNMLKQMQNQVDILNGINTSVMSLADATAALAQYLTGGTSSGSKASTTGSSGSGGARGSFGAGQGDYSPTSSKYKQVTWIGGSDVGYLNITDQDVISHLDSLAGIYHSFDGTGDLEGLLSAIKDAGGSLSDLSALSGYYESDWEKAAASVDVPAFINGGSHSGGIRLVGEGGPELEVTGPARYYNANQTANMLGNSDQISELSSRLDNMSYELRAIAVASAKTAKILDNVTPNKTSISTTAA